MSEAPTGPGLDPRRESIESGLLAAIIVLRVMVSAEIHPWTGFLNNAGLALLLLLFLVSRPRQIWQGAWPIRLGLVLYLAALLSSTALSLDPLLSRRQALQDLGGVLLALAVAGRGPRGLRAVAAALAAGAAASAAFALRQRLGGFEQTLASGAAGRFAVNVLKAGRVFGLTFSPDMLAAAMAGAIPPALALAMSARAESRGRGRALPSWQLAAALATVPIMGAALVLSRSLGGWLAAGMGVVTWIALRQGAMAAGIKRRRLAPLAVALLVMTAGAAAIVAARGGHHLDLTNPNNPVTMRLDNWSTGLKVAREFPAAGAGPGGYQLAAFLHRGLSSNEARHAHNLLVDALADTGPLGLLGLVLILAGLGRAALRLAGSRGEESGPKDRELRLGLFAGAAAVAAHALIDYSFQTVEVAVFFWAGLGAAMQAPDRTDTGEVRSRSGKVLVAAAALALVLTSVTELRQMSLSRLIGEAQAAASGGDWTRARELALKARERGGEDDQLLLLLAHAAAKTERDPARARKMAAAYLEAAIAASPRNPFHWRDLGLVLSVKDPQRAEQCLRRSVALYPNSQDLNLELGRFLRRTGRLEEAGAILDSALDDGFPKGEIFIELSLIAKSEGRIKAEEIYLRKAAYSHPFDGRAALAYAQFLMEHGRGGEAFQFLRKWRGRHPVQESMAARIRALELESGGGVTPEAATGAGGKTGAGP